MKKLIAIAGVILISAGLAAAKDLATYRANCDKQMEEIILSHGMKMNNLSQQYTKYLKVVLAKVQKAGDLDKTTAVMNEIERFREENAMPEKPSALLDIQTLQSAFSKQAFSYEATKAKSIISLMSKYDTALERLQKSFVSAGNLDDARKVQEERKQTLETEAYKQAKACVSSSVSQSPPPITKPQAARKKAIPFSLKEGIVLHYTFDKKSDKTVTDQSRKHNNGTVNGATWVQDGKNGGAYDFDEKDCIIVKNSSSLNPKEAVSFSAWVKPSSIDAHRRILQKGDSDNQYRLTGNCKLELRGIGTVSAPLLRANSWNHVLATYDGRIMILYADGNKVAEQKAVGNIPSTTSNLHIGTKKSPGAFIDNFQGSIDEVIIYERALSEKEVKELYESQK